YGPERVAGGGRQRGGQALTSRLDLNDANGDGVSGAATETISYAESVNRLSGYARRRRHTISSAAPTSTNAPVDGSGTPVTKPPSVGFSKPTSCSEKLHTSGSGTPNGSLSPWVLACGVTPSVGVSTAMRSTEAVWPSSTLNDPLKPPLVK